MKQEDLIEKLENLETPEIELPGHRQALKMALLNSGRFEKRTIMDWAKILAPVTAAVALLVVVGFFNVIQPQLQIAQAKEIARNDLHVQALLAEYGLEIAEVELQNGEAFVLLAPRSTSALFCESDAGVFRIFRWAVPSPSSEERLSLPDEQLFPGYVVKVDLLEKKVSELGEIDEVTTLKDIDVADIDFVKLEPAEFVAPQEADVD